MQAAVFRRLSKIWIDERRRLSGARKSKPTTPRRPKAQPPPDDDAEQQYRDDLAALDKHAESEECAAVTTTDPAYVLIERTFDIRHAQTRENKWATLKEYFEEFPFMTAWRMVCEQLAVAIASY